MGAARGIINSKIQRAITWPDKSFKENVFLLEKIVGSAHVLSTKSFFSLDRIQIKYGYGEKEKKRNLEVPPPPTVTKLIFWRTVVVLQYTHHI